ncbi:type II toxin-antitoxin system death-on-curing family toxin [Candidatus Nomurabacteria bacterium]|nr:type II toxin-antitoxin system death-on-curing family toxin [Candidatus Nomurabacteria bacterium]
MTEKEKSKSVRYLSEKDVIDIYLVLFDRFKEIGEPIPPLVKVNIAQIENLVVIPQTKHFGVEQYPTLESKAAILFYKINKGHIFPNGNKRISLACLLVFLEINNRQLEITEDEVTLKAIEIAKSDPQNFDNVKKELESWIKSNLREKRDKQKD